MAEVSDMQFAEQMKARTKLFALRIIKMFRSLPKSVEAQIVGKQILRSGTSVGANYRAVCRARSGKDFISKLGVVIEEADESLFWMELLVEAEIIRQGKMASLMEEGDALLRIFSSSYSTARRRSLKKAAKIL